MSVSFEEANYYVLESSPSSVNICVALTGSTERDLEVNVTAIEVTAQREIILFMLAQNNFCARISTPQMDQTEILSSLPTPLSSVLMVESSSACLPQS